MDEIKDVLAGISPAYKNMLLKVYNHPTWKSPYSTTEYTMDYLNQMWWHDANLLEKREANWDKLSTEEKEKYKIVYRKVWGREAPINSDGKVVMDEDYWESKYNLINKTLNNVEQKKRALDGIVN